MPPTLERVSDSPEERLAQLRFLRRVQAQDLERTDQWIAIWEERAAEWVRRAQKPAPPAWTLELDRREQPVLVHAAGCWTPAVMRPINREQAIEALTRGGVPACTRCEPDKELGVLD